MTKTWLITIMLFIIIIVLSFLKLIPHNLFNEDIHINCQDNTMTITGDGLLTKQDIDNYFINSIYQKNTIVNVVVENGIDEIGYRCFENFENLQKISIIALSTQAYIKNLFFISLFKQKCRFAHRQFFSCRLHIAIGNVI